MAAVDVSLTVTEPAGNQFDRKTAGHEAE